MYPVVDGITVFEDYTARAKEGKFSKVVSAYLDRELIGCADRIVFTASYSWYFKQRGFEFAAVDPGWGDDEFYSC